MPLEGKVTVSYISEKTIVSLSVYTISPPLFVAGVSNSLK
jgi:hypothetical protein